MMKLRNGDVIDAGCIKAIQRFPEMTGTSPYPERVVVYAEVGNHMVMSTIFCENGNTEEIIQEIEDQMKKS